jgi:hypothetical protein
MTELIKSNQTELSDDLVGVSSTFHIVLLALAMFSLSFVTVLGNTVVIYALRTNRHLRTVRKEAGRL